jgi:hypothetical protein
VTEGAQRRCHIFSLGPRFDALVGDEIGIKSWRPLGFEDDCLTMERDSQIQQPDTVISSI